MELIDRYLQAVGFWLPRHQKQDILAELSEDLHSQVEDREGEINRPLTDPEVAAILKRRGRPILVAGTFLPQRNLIGPVLFPIYIFVLKIVALCYLLPWFLVWIFILIFNSAQSGKHIPVDMHPIGTFWTLLWTMFGVVTFIFAMLDRASTRSKLFDDWDPIKLPKVKLKQATRRRCEAIAGIAFGVLGLWWLLIIPKYPFLVLGPGAYFLTPAPIWHSVHALLLVLASIGIVEHAAVLLRPQAVWIRPALALASTALGLWTIRILQQTHTYLLATDPHAAQAAVVVNQITAICLLCAALGLVIRLGITLWQAVQESRRTSHFATPHLA
jgi:hypothetical protein